MSIISKTFVVMKNYFLIENTRTYTEKSFETYHLRNIFKNFDKIFVNIIVYIIDLKYYIDKVLIEKKDRYNSQ
jgi:hypothetical protein